MDSSGCVETENVELKCKYNITGVLCTGLYIMVHLEYKVFHKWYSRELFLRDLRLLNVRVSEQAMVCEQTLPNILNKSF